MMAQETRLGSFSHHLLVTAVNQPAPLSRTDAAPWSLPASRPMASDQDDVSQKAECLPSSQSAKVPLSYSTAMQPVPAPKSVTKHFSIRGEGSLL